jgi:Na+-driven multidrug efflux pump
MIGMLVSALFNLADAYFVGKLGTTQVGAIAVAFPIIQIVVGVGMTFGTGAASYISRLLGENNYHKANQTASTAILNLLIFQTVLIVASIAFIEPVLHLLGASDTIMPYAKTYNIIYISGTLFSVFYVAMNNIVIAEGAAKLTMTAMMLGAGLNIILDPIFIYVFD